MVSYCLVCILKKCFNSNIVKYVARTTTNPPRSRYYNAIGIVINGG